MNFSELAASRHSVRHYQPGLTIDDATLTSIFEDVLLSPSSFNLQHWSFVVVRDAARKQALRAVSFGQAQVEDSEPFEEKMRRLAATLREQQAEAARLDAAIAKNLRELGYGG